MHRCGGVINAEPEDSSHGRGHIGASLAHNAPAFVTRCEIGNGKTLVMVMVTTIMIIILISSNNYNNHNNNNNSNNIF
jgi:hypothetical protein